MTEWEPTADALAPPARLRRPSVFRQAVEFLAILATGILIARTFAAEAYIVPTGSMAPTLLGMHRAYVCPNCRFRFALGIDEDGRGGRAVCPNCGQHEEKGASWVEAYGDRLLVHKFLFDLRPPQRWEAAVFQNPADPGQAYVKRIVGLPGESVLIRGGDVYIDGQIARKSIEQQRALRILVYDNDFVPADSDRYPRWLFRLDGVSPWRGGVSGWRSEGPRLVHDPDGGSDDRIDWAHYRHWQADANHYGPIRDFTAYNGLDLPGENRVEDLMVEADIEAEEGVTAFAIRLVSGNDRFTVTIPARGPGGVEVRRNGRLVEVLPTAAIPSIHDRRFVSSPKITRKHHVEASLADRRLMVLVDGRMVFEPLDFEPTTTGPIRTLSPVSLGVKGDGRAVLSGVRIYRDVYYTDALINAPRRPFGVDEPYQLGPDEYFVLGDNSPVSNDSRFWPESPVVRRELFVGKPFLVHLPSQAVPLQVFGRELYWIPDPREIRYIR